MKLINKIIKTTTKVLNTITIIVTYISSELEYAINSATYGVNLLEPNYKNLKQFEEYHKRMKRFLDNSYYVPDDIVTELEKLKSAIKIKYNEIK